MGDCPLLFLRSVWEAGKHLILRMAICHCMGKAVYTPGTICIMDKELWRRLLERRSGGSPRLSGKSCRNSNVCPQLLCGGALQFLCEPGLLCLFPSGSGSAPCHWDTTG